MTNAAIMAPLENDFTEYLDAYQNAPPEEPDPETAIPAPFYMMFAGALGESTEDILDLLAERDQRVTFFLTAETIHKNEALVRRLYIEGHHLGVAAPNGLPESPEALIAAWDAANAELFRVLRITSRSCYLPGGSLHEAYDDAWFDAFDATGYCAWDLTIVAQDYLADATGETVLESTIASLISVELVQTLAFHTVPSAYNALPGLLDYVAERGGTILTADLLTEPVHATVEEIE